MPMNIKIPEIHNDTPKMSEELFAIILEVFRASSPEIQITPYDFINTTH